MNKTVHPVQKALEHMVSERLPRGEVWLGTDFIQAAGLEDTVEGHLRLAGQD